MSIYNSIAGRRFGKLLVIQETPEVRKHGCATVYCQCDCGESVYVEPFRLRNGSVVSCGCGRGRRVNPKTMVGNRYGNLTVLDVSDNVDPQGRTLLYCRCDCGNIAYVPAYRLRNGNTKSCGCRRQADLTGRKFGRLTALEPTEERSGGTRVWKCRCDCGNITYAAEKKLVSGMNTGCGCRRGTVPKDITGQRFGKLTAVRRLEEKAGSSYKWLCRCDCGGEKTAGLGSLVSGQVRSCGCEKQTRELRDITGETFGRLTVLERMDEAQQYGSRWLCRCSCGGIKTTTYSKLVSGHVKSCGCLRGAPPKKDITGQRFGKLTALERTGEKSGSTYKWRCICDCGNETAVSLDKLRKGTVRSCGCLKGQPAKQETFKKISISPARPVSRREISV